MRRLALIVALAAFAGLLGLHPRSLAADQGVKRFDHVFLIIEENEAYATLLPSPTPASPSDPHIIHYAGKYGLATDYFGLAHPSEENYVGMLGGTTNGISDDDDYTCPNSTVGAVMCNGVSVVGPIDLSPALTNQGYAWNYPNHTLFGANLASQLTDAGKGWRGYFQSMPNRGYMGDCAAGGATQGSTGNCIYASKHNGFVNFDSVQDSPAQQNNMYPIEQLTDDLGHSGHLPDFSYIIPDQCHDMHSKGGCSNPAFGGDATDCTNSSASVTANDACITDADTYLHTLVHEIRHSDAWQHGHNAIVITWDESDPAPGGSQDSTGCCDAGILGGVLGGGGQIPTIVITNSEKGHFAQPTDSGPNNHYSLLLTLEDGFGLPCVANTCDNTPSPKGVHPMGDIFNP